MISSEIPAAVPPALGRRSACAAFGASLLTLALAACAGAQPRWRDPDHKPFWEREEQRD